MLFSSKKGFAEVAGIILTVVFICVVLAVGLLILGKFKGKLTIGSEEYNATGDIITELAGVPTYIGILIIVAIMGFILAYLMGWMGGQKKMG